MTPEPNTSYPSFILYDEQFKKGSAITVKTSSSIRDKDCVARIDKIYTNEECQPFLDITWYYRPEELPTGRQAHHGRDEVLESDLTDTISVDCVNSSAVVHTLEQFQARDSIPLTNTLGNFVPEFFSRSFFKHKTGKLKEPLPLYCLCRKPCNPDRTMIACDICQKWYHAKCVKLTEAQAQTLEVWFCPSCTSAPLEKRHKGLST
eukprot:TRINITY_DN11125_c1_g2_i1.p1 TRINITY_DN11125_c1_g2~~TRINITY_DN11125_c1_g2_i1.p1  ORF type:complete len:205 (+),score=13.84 TRINITY_DN11125_c1_g2_i1:64-678(+)